MLGETFRFQVLNETGQTINVGSGGDVVINTKLSKFDSNGALSFDVETEQFNLSSNLTDGSYSSGSAIDNSTDKWLGGDVEITVTTDNASSAGDVSIFLQRSTDGGTTWPSDGEGIPIAVFTFTTNETQRKVVEI